MNVIIANSYAAFLSPRRRTRRIRLGFLAFRAGLLAILVPEIQRRLVAMMPIGDHELLRRHRRFDSPDRVRIGHRPEPVQHVELIAHLDRGISSRDIFEQRLNLSRLLVVQHEKLPRLRPRMTQQLDAVSFRRRKRPLVREHHPRAVIFHAPQRNKPDARPPRLRPRHQIILRVDVNRRRPILHQNFRGNPFLKLRRRPRVDVVLGRIARRRLALLNRNQVVSARRVIPLLHLRRDLVVGLRQHIFQCNAVRIVAVSSKGANLSHVGLSRQQRNAKDKHCSSRRRRAQSCPRCLKRFVRVRIPWALVLVFGLVVFVVVFKVMLGCPFLNSRAAGRGRGVVRREIVRLVSGGWRRLEL